MLVLGRGVQLLHPLRNRRGAREGTLDFNRLPILETDTDFYDGVAFAGRESGAATEGQIAIAGLAVPYQLKDEEILFDPAKNKTGLLNRIGDIVYTVWDGKKTAEFWKPVTLTRTFVDGSVYDSILEFYHVFPREEIDPYGDYVVSLYGIDLNGERVDGTEETFVINRAPE